MSNSTDKVLAEGRKKLGIRTNKPKNNNTSKEGGNMKKFIKGIFTETVKTVMIWVLVTAIVAFVAGMRYQTQFDKQVEAKAQAVAKQQAKVEPSKQ